MKKQCLQWLRYNDIDNIPFEMYHEPLPMYDMLLDLIGDNNPVRKLRQQFNSRIMAVIKLEKAINATKVTDATLRNLTQIRSALKHDLISDFDLVNQLSLRSKLFK